MCHDSVGRYIYPIGLNVSDLCGVHTDWGQLEYRRRHGLPHKRVRNAREPNPDKRGVTAEEIARKQGVTETAIRIRLLRARRAARSRVEKRAARIQEHHKLTLANAAA